MSSPDNGLQCSACPMHRLPGLLAAFLMFRLLDVAKPGPIGWADRQGGAAGIMADDLIAGAHHRVHHLGDPFALARTARLIR